MEIKGKGNQDSLYIRELTKESLEESCEHTIPEINIQTEIEMVQKEEANTENMFGNVGILYERLISNLKSDMKFLKISSL